ncbi:hypothetical protein RN001_003209, partial [Aquatica leii]
MLFTILIYTTLSAIATAHRRIFFREAKTEDQVSESSGYHYTSSSYSPDIKSLNHLYYPSSDISPYLQQFPESSESFHYYYPNYKSFQHYTPEEYSYWPNLYKGFDRYRYGYDKSLGDFKNYQDIGDKIDNYDSTRYAAHGKLGDAAFQSMETYDKGLNGKHHDEAHKGYYNKEGSDKDGYYGNSEYFAKNNAGGKGYKGESYGESSGHKKGSKTTGFHKVYNKNEYKKDHTFYDESDKRGHFNKYAHGDSYHEKKEGDVKNGGRSNYGFHKVNQGENGSYDKGHYDANDNKFRDQQGKGGYQEDYSNYNQGNEKSYEKRHGFHDSDEVNFLKNYHVVVMKSVLVYSYDHLTTKGCCRLLNPKHAAVTAAVYTLNISILVILIYSWRISVNVKKYASLEDVYYGVQIAYLAIIGTHLFMIVLSIVLLLGIHK